MSAYLWLSKLNVSPDAICRCGHAAKDHLHGKGCGASMEGFQLCKCNQFHEAKSEQEIIMAKAKKNGTPKKKGEGRTPTLAPYAETLAGKTIYINHDGKEHTATVLTSGVIRMNDKDYTSPSSAAGAILGKNKKGKQLQADGWRCWRFNKDGERVELNVLRGKDSPLKVAAAPKREKKAKSAKANGAPKPKRTRKPKRSNASPLPAPVHGASATESSADAAQ